MDDFALTAASLCYRENSGRLHALFRTIQARRVHSGISFSILKPELRHERTLSQRHSQVCLSPIQLEREVFHPRHALQWLRYWFTPTLCTATHLSHRLAVAQGPFALIRRLSPPGLGSPPTYAPDWQRHLSRLSSGTGQTPSLQMHAPSRDSTLSSTGWRGAPQTVFSSTPIAILIIESCLPPVPILVSHCHRLAALRTICSPPAVNHVTVPLNPSFPSLSSHRVLDSSRALTKGLSSFYLHHSWVTPRRSHPL